MSPLKNKNYPLYELPQLESLNDMIISKKENMGGSACFRYRQKRDICEKSFADVYEDIASLAAVFSDTKDKHIAIIGENSYEWIVTFLACVVSGNVAVPIDKEYPGEEMLDLMQMTDTTTAFCGKAAARKLEALILDEEGVNKSDITLYKLDEFEKSLESGRELLRFDKSKRFTREADVDKLAAIFFTSGTTGKSKGVMLSQRNMYSDINAACKNFNPYGNTVSVLPFHHTFGFITAILKPYNYGVCTFINSGLKRMLEDIKREKPETMFMVPLFIENFYKTIRLKAKKEGKLKTLTRATKFSDALLRAGIDKRADFFKDIQQTFGGNLDYIICGGAPLDPMLVKVFRSWGIEILNGYGITECSPVIAVNRNFYKVDGSVGIPFEGVSVEIADDEEIIVKGDNVMMGYYNNQDATDEVLTDGWYHTGDLGMLDKKGFLHITGRKKNLIILSNGENVSPEVIEQEIMRYDGIEEVVVYGVKGHLVAEIYPSEEYMGNVEHFMAIRDSYNKNEPQFRHISEIKLRDTEFEKNSSRKIIRAKVGVEE